MQEKYPTIYVSSFWLKKINWHLQTKKGNIYVSRWCIYNPFVEMIKGGSNIQHPTLGFNKENTASWKNCEGILTTFILEYLIILYSSGDWCIDGR